ncbi:MAG: hypothetical protein HIU93_14885 [Acidobacteria bacterium]|nr:hypothetical protein [Acidobacteriota bacterium]MBW4043479.1 hypothetical protein [Acidobacteriota bacterium]
MSSLVDGTRVYSELWTSFVSLIRSYAAAHELGRKSGHAVIEASSSQLTVTMPDSLLTIAFDEKTGHGRWTLATGQQSGTFRIHEDSTVEFSDRMGRIDLEIAAEAFTAKILDEDRAA